LLAGEGLVTSEGRQDPICAGAHAMVWTMEADTKNNCQGAEKGDGQ